MGTKSIERRDVSFLAYGIMIFMIITMALAPIIMEYIFNSNLSNENVSIYFVENSYSFIGRFYIYFIGITIFGAIYMLSKEIKSRIKAN